MTQNAPNLFQLTGHHLHITYSTSGIDGRPHFSYQDAAQTLTFAGEQIRVVECDLGMLASVTIRPSVDSGSTSFTLLVPRVVLDGTTPQSIRTEGITTIHKFSIVPRFNLGQDDLYTVTALHGTASFVVF